MNYVICEHYWLPSGKSIIIDLHYWLPSGKSIIIDFVKLHQNIDICMSFCEQLVSMFWTLGILWTINICSWEY